MIRVPFYVFIVLIIALVIKVLPLFCPKIMRWCARGLSVLFVLVSFYITLLSRLIHKWITANVISNSAQIHDTVDPNAPVILGHAGSTWLAQKQGITGWRLIWIAFSDQNTVLYIIPSCILNILMFIPLGMLLPASFHTFRDNRKYSVFAGCAMSFSIEIIQLWTGLGQFDIADLICNTSGAFIGWMIWQKFLLNTWINADTKDYNRE